MTRHPSFGGRSEEKVAHMESGTANEKLNRVVSDMYPGGQNPLDLATTREESGARISLTRTE